jgi:ankyrin repeat protein
MAGRRCHWLPGTGRRLSLSCCLKHKTEADSKDKYGRRPLSCAAENGHEVVVNLLLETGQAEADSKDNDSRTGVSVAFQDLQKDREFQQLAIQHERLKANQESKTTTTPKS